MYLFSFIFSTFMINDAHLCFQAENYELLTVHQQKTVDLMLKMDKKLTLIPLIFICLRVWSTVRFVLYLCHSDAITNVVLMCLHVSTITFVENITYSKHFSSVEKYIENHIRFLYLGNWKQLPRRRKCNFILLYDIKDKKKAYLFMCGWS